MLLCASTLSRQHNTIEKEKKKLQNPIVVILMTQHFSLQHQHIASASHFRSFSLISSNGKHLPKRVSLLGACLQAFYHHYYYIIIVMNNTTMTNALDNYFLTVIVIIIVIQLMHIVAVHNLICLRYHFVRI